MTKKGQRKTRGERCREEKETRGRWSEAFEMER
jgi:hypothetical protein